MWTVEIIYNINRAHRTYMVRTLEEALEVARKVTLESQHDHYSLSDITGVHIEQMEE